jgi:hypothetical protein
MRRSPVRIYQARRVALVNRLRGDGVGDETAERWVAAWESVGDGLDRDTSGFWEEAARWIDERRARRERP